MSREYHPRPWPYLAAAARDCAAEEIAAALNCACPLAETSNEPSDLKRIARIINHLQNALRHLERAGANTRPPEP